MLYGRTYDPPGLATQEQVEEALDQAGIDTESFNASLLQEPWETKNGSGNPFQVFTPYWRKSRPIIYREPVSYEPSNLSFHSSPTPKLSIDDLDLLPDHSWHQKLEEHWTVSESAAHEQLERTVNEVTHSYATRRNNPSVDGTSRLSPYLAWGLISPRQICQGVLQADNEGSHRGENKFLVEIGWREFSYHLLYHYPSIPDQPLRPNMQLFRGSMIKRILSVGNLVIPATPWSMPVCANFMKPGGCTTVCAWWSLLSVKHLLISWTEGARWFWDPWWMPTSPAIPKVGNGRGMRSRCGSYFRIFNPITQGKNSMHAGLMLRNGSHRLKTLQICFQTMGSLG